MFNFDQRVTFDFQIRAFHVQSLQQIHVSFFSIEKYHKK